MRAPGGELDAEALEAIGIDLAAIRGKLEEAFGEGVLDNPAQASRGWRLPFSPGAKKALELSLREAIAMRDNHISDGHLLLGLIRGGDKTVARVLADAGADQAALRQRIITELG
jgi:ATP-dependent Clp protease ATP-binding subunit ClpA